jgi:hypothetical protein
MAKILFEFLPYCGQGDPNTDYKVLRAITMDEVSLDSRDEYGNSLLIAACQNRNEDIGKLLIDKGADVRAANLLGGTSLHFACFSGSSSQVLAKLLLEKGADPNRVEDTNMCSPLHYAASAGDVVLVMLLLAYGADPSVADARYVSSPAPAGPPASQPASWREPPARLPGEKVAPARGGGGGATARGRFVSERARRRGPIARLPPSSPPGCRRRAL